MAIYVYTDGACSNNGRKNAKAGIGIYFGPLDPRNYSHRISGKQTNNTAELKAILKAVDILKTDISAGNTVHIYSDSTYAIRCFTTYGHKLEQTHWTKTIPNLSLVKKGFSIFKNNSRLILHHIKSHTHNTDTHSIGNKEADTLAKNAIHQSTTTPSNTKKRLYLNLPYKDKEEGKRLGTKWDFKKKKWYITLDTDNQHLILNKWGI